MVKLSERLKTVASLVGSGGVLADIGTDHGYIPIYLVESGRIPRVICRAIAMDINKGPLARAKGHIAAYGMEQYIETRLSDGVAALEAGEADSIVIAGMGGGLVMKILTDGEAVCRAAKELVLQPQSQLKEVRRFLAEHGYAIDAEEMVKEDGKYYPMMRVHSVGGVLPHPDEVSFRYGALLLQNQHPVLLEYLKKEETVYQDILQNLDHGQAGMSEESQEKSARRREEIGQVLCYNQMAQACFGIQNTKKKPYSV